MTNSGDAEASNLRLSIAPNSGVPASARIAPAAPSSLPPGGGLAYQLTVPAWQGVAPPAELALLARYRAGTSDQAAGTAVELLAPVPLDPDKLASVELKASLATLKSGQAESVYLVVRNKSAQPVTVKRVVPTEPSSIEFASLPQNVEIGPGRVAVLDVEAKAESRVRPGEQQLVFRLAMESGETRFDLVASQTAKVAVAGESELLTAFGIPSLLLLPGFLLIATASILWRVRLLRPESDGADFPFPLKEAEFWVLAIIASLGIVFAATWFGIDLLDRYGLEDLARLWIASMLLGLILYVATLLVRNRTRASRVPATGDTAIAVLEKLAKQRLTLDRPRFTYDTGGGATVRMYLLQPENEARPSTWASPEISYRWTDGVDEALNEEIQDQLDRDHDAGALAGIFERGRKANLLEVSFGGNTSINSPQLMPKEKLTSLGSPEVMVEEKR